MSCRVCQPIPTDIRLGILNRGIFDEPMTGEMSLSAGCPPARRELNQVARRRHKAACAAGYRRIPERERLTVIVVRNGLAG